MRAARIRVEIPPFLQQVAAWSVEVEGDPIPLRRAVSLSGRRVGVAVRAVSFDERSVAAAELKLRVLLTPQRTTVVRVPASLGALAALLRRRPSPSAVATALAPEIDPPIL